MAVRSASTTKRISGHVAVSDLLFVERIGDGVPLGFGLGLAFLGVDRLERRRNCGALLSRSMRQGVARFRNPLC